MPRLSNFIRDNTEQLLSEWETFARNLAVGDSMNVAALRDHAKAMLGTIAHDLDMPQTGREEVEKAIGASDADEHGAPATAAQEHGADRAESGFTVAQILSELRALRASVIRLWVSQLCEVAVTDLEDMTRFNEAIDQAIAESMTQYSEEIRQSKERFLAVLGHDLRTPLGAIVVSASFMVETSDLVEPHRTLAARIANSARRMSQMVADLIDFTRTGFGDDIPIVRAEMDVTHMVHNVVSEVASAYPDTTVEIETSGVLHGQWDVHRLTQALTNVLGNAVQHGRDNAPIRVSAHGTPKEVVISVQNEGPVIPTAQLGQIFRAGTQAAPDGARDSNHLGLGLFIVDKIVKAHGGSIDVRSSEEPGTTFTVHLPRAT